MIDGQQVLSVHGDDDGVPDLRDQDLGFVLDLHVGSSQNLRVYTLWKPRENVTPRSPDRYTEIEGSCYRENRVEDNVPEVGIEEEQNHFRKYHQGKKNLRLVPANVIFENLVSDTSMHLENGENSNRISEGKRQEKVGFGELCSCDQCPETPGHPNIVSFESGITSCEGLTGNILTRVLGKITAEETSKRGEREPEDCHDGYAELNNANSQRYRSRILAHAKDVDRRTCVEDEHSDEEKQPLG
jgi:hypothetical protein